MPLLPFNRTRAAAALATVATVALIGAGCGSSSSSSSGSGDQTGAQSTSTPASAPPTAATGAPVESATVDIKSFKFKPVTIAVKKGGRVRWTNSDAAAHTSTADDRSFDTQTIDKGKARMVTFTEAGTFPYHCDFHPFMKATVVVK